MSAFFGLKDDYKISLHKEIFSLVYHGGGGFTLADVYAMPVWLRRAYIRMANDEVRKVKESREKQAEEAKNASRRSSFKGLSSRHRR